MKLPISIIILTFNEEKNIEACLKTLVGFAEEIFIVDSYSTDKTLEIAKKYTDKISQHPFENYSKQRNWAFENLPIKTEWIFNMDADHRLTPGIISELEGIFSKPIDKNINSFLASRQTMFMERWIKHGGHYPVYHAMLFRKGKGRCENRFYDQHFVVEGNHLKLKNNVIDIISDSLNKFTRTHLRWSVLEAVEQLAGGYSEIKPKMFGNPIEHRRFLREFYNSLPIFVRPVIYFIYRYFIRLGFLDGKEGLIFHFLQCFWYRFLIDAMIYEIKKNHKKTGKPIKQVILELHNISL
jgi:glycosyltransferase involved in cell wall biosynthesis